jgi:hypothetical protein
VPASVIKDAAEMMKIGTAFDNPDLIPPSLGTRIPRALEIFRLRLENLDKETRELDDRKRRLFQEIGSGLRMFRESKGVSLREVSRNAGFSGPFVSDVELGRRRVNEKLLLAYASTTKVS